MDPADEWLGDEGTVEGAQASRADAVGGRQARRPCMGGGRPPTPWQDMLPPKQAQGEAAHEEGKGTCHGPGGMARRRLLSSCAAARQGTLRCSWGLRPPGGRYN